MITITLPRWFLILICVNLAIYITDRALAFVALVMGALS